MLPNAFDGIKLRAVGRQEIEPQNGLALFEKGREKRSVGVSCVVQDDYAVVARASAVTQQDPEKLLERKRVELRSKHRD